MSWKSKDWARFLAFLAITLFVGEAIAVLSAELVPPPVAAALLVLCIGVFSVWFLVAFTGDARDRTDSMFLFAYVFTFVSFGMLVLPPVPSDQTSDRSPLAVIRGCAVGSGADSGLFPYPKSMLCITEPAGAGAVAPQATSSQLSLLAVGGVSGDRAPAGCGSKALACEHVRITSGLAVPMYVIILAFVGGAVSLSRRIPEYQKRSDIAFLGSDGQSPLAAVDAREGVVFQIMQLLSAPFIAMSAYYIVGPSTLATAVGLAFACGFASEPILLMIRGMISGIRPEGTRLSSSQRLSISGLIENGQGPVSSASILVSELPNFSTTSDATGQYTIPDLVRGEYNISVSAGKEAGTSKVIVKDANVVEDIAIK